MAETAYTKAAYDRHRHRANRKQKARAGPPRADVADRIQHFVDFCASLKTPPGPRAGKPMSLGDWQIDFIRRALAPDTSEAYLVVARRNGKSATIALLILWNLVSEARIPGYKIGICSLSGKHVGLLMDQVANIAAANGIECLTVRKQPPVLYGLDGTEAHFWNANPKTTAAGIGTDIFVADEIGIYEESARATVSNMLGATVGRDGVFVGISIRGSSPFLNEAYLRRADPGVVWVEYAAPDGAAPDDEAALRAANPGIEQGIVSLRSLKAAARRAIAIGGAELSKFRSLHCNNPMSPRTELLVDPTDWHACEVDELPPRAGHCLLGLDAGGSSSMTCAVAYFPESGRLECYAAFPDRPDLMTRGRADSVGDLYQRCADRGELWIYPGRITNVAAFIADVAAALEAEDVLMIADRYRQREIEDALENSGAYWDIEWRAVGSGRDGHADIRDAQKMIKSRRVQSLENLVLRSAIRRSSIVYKDGQNPSLKPWRSVSRIDAVQALVLALGGGARNETPTTFTLLGAY